MSSSGNSMTEYKIVVMGAGAVGKSALVLRYVCDEFLEEYDPTIEDTYRKETQIDGTTVVLDILDTAGQEVFRSMQDDWILKGQGFILVYDITVAKTFQDIEDFKTKVRRTKENVPILLVGNKSDLANERREVSFEEGQALAKRLKCTVLETSAKDGTNVAAAFETMTKLIKNGKSESPQNKKKKLCNIL